MLRYVNAMCRQVCQAHTRRLGGSLDRLFIIKKTQYAGQLRGKSRTTLKAIDCHRMTSAKTLQLVSPRILVYPSEGNSSAILTRPAWKAWSFILYGNASGRSTSLAALNMLFSHLGAGCQGKATVGQGYVLAMRAHNGCEKTKKRVLLFKF